MTRFWISVEQSVAFVLRCLEWMEGGEIFVPKIPSMKLIDLAEALAPGIEKRITGVRPGEKLHELLISQGELTMEREDHFCVTEAGSPGLVYASDSNSDWLSSEQLRALL